MPVRPLVSFYYKNWVSGADSQTQRIYTAAASLPDRPSAFDTLWWNGSLLRRYLVVIWGVVFLLYCLEYRPLFRKFEWLDYPICR